MTDAAREALDLERLARRLCAVDRVEADGLAYAGMQPMRCWEARLPAARAAALDVIEQLMEPTAQHLLMGARALRGTATDANQAARAGEVWCAMLSSVKREVARSGGDRKDVDHE